ncbi:MAG: IS200/IS605 family transposase [Crocinitomicaceae bacterium]|nr:IS200/IS605 family transposase [Crocinitomicaceae bacterium]
MGQSLVKNYIHIVFSTKHRIHMIDDAIENELYAYLGGICNNLECQVLKVGGYTNHIHILCLLSKKITLAKLLAEVKANSSRWMKTKGEKYQNFYWQDGYGAFSVRQSEVQVVSNYITNQKEHHNKRSFKDEYRDVLKEHGLEFDEKYVWD